MAPTVTLFSTYADRRGLFARLAKKLHLDPSYISRVANGKRRCKRVSLAIEAELNRMYAAYQKIAKPHKSKSRLNGSKKLSSVAR